MDLMTTETRTMDLMTVPVPGMVTALKPTWSCDIPRV
jgi:hypothetical protein